MMILHATPWKPPYFTLNKISVSYSSVTLCNKQSYKWSPMATSSSSSLSVCDWLLGIHSFWLFVCIFHSDYTHLYRCVTSGAQLQTKGNGHLSFQCVIDCWGVLSDAAMPGAILSCKVVATCGFSNHKFVTK